MNSEPTSTRGYDVIIIGGALAGAATAILLLREQPKRRVLVVEKSAVFTRRVGEATVEVSGYFLGRTLGLMQYLNDAHLVKQGMRFHFFNEKTETLEECSEIGGRYLARVPAFQVDRSTLDEEVLRRARALGAEVWRPASAQKIQLAAGGQQSVTVRRNDLTQTVQARWVVDASGVTALLSRQQGWWRANPAHPTTAVWSRWRGVKDWDGCDLAQKFPKWAQACYGIRGTATNHLVGDGWWAWMIPLKGGDVSIGAVFDQRLMEWPENGSLGQRLKDFLCRHPVGRELMGDAQWVEGDVHWRKNLPYYSTTYAGDGFALAGDAGSFLDPFYSPGMDWLSFTTYTTAQLILAQQRGEEMAPLLARHNRDFTRSYARWFDAVYRGKYEYLGDYDLMRLAFLLDISFYYLGVAAQPFKRGVEAFREPLFSNPASVPFYYLMRTYGRRFAAMGRSRRARGVWGRRNAGHRFMFPGYTFSGGSAGPIVKALWNWAWLELTEGWRSWFAREFRPTPAEKPSPLPAPAPVL